MKNGKLIMLPLLSATFLLSSCNNGNQDKNSSSSDKSDNTSNVDSSEENKSSDSSSISIEEDADTDLAILKKAVSNTISQNGFKAVTSPIKATVAGKKYESSAADDNATKKTDWDAIINIDSLTYASTYVDNDLSLDEINQVLKLEGMHIGYDKFGIAPLVNPLKGESSESANKRMNKIIDSLSFSENLYYAGTEYKDRLYYDDYDKNGDESDVTVALIGMQKPILEALDSAGYSVYNNDNKEEGAKYSINPTGYIQLAIDEEKEEDAKKSLPQYETGDAFLDYLETVDVDFSDNIISTKSGDVYTLNLVFSSKEVMDAINQMIDSLDDDWEFTLPVEEDSPFADIVVTKETLKAISEKISDSLEVKKFDYSINYNENKIISSKLDFDLTIDDSVYESYLKDDEASGDETTTIGVSSLNFSSSVSFSTYEKTAQDSDETAFKDNLWNFAELPSKADLADTNKYPEQPLPEKKANA